MNMNSIDPTIFIMLFLIALVIIGVIQIIIMKMHNKYELSEAEWDHMKKLLVESHTEAIDDFFLILKSKEAIDENMLDIANTAPEPKKVSMSPKNPAPIIRKPVKLSLIFLLVLLPFTLLGAQTEPELQYISSYLEVLIYLLGFIAGLIIILIVTIGLIEYNKRKAKPPNDSIMGYILRDPVNSSKYTIVPLKPIEERVIKIKRTTGTKEAELDELE